MRLALPLRGTFSTAYECDARDAEVREFLEYAGAVDIHSSEGVVAFRGPSVLDIGNRGWTPMLGIASSGKIFLPPPGGRDGTFILRVKPYFWSIAAVIILFPLGLALIGDGPASDPLLAAGVGLLVFGGWAATVYLRFKHGLAHCFRSV